VNPRDPDAPPAPATATVPAPAAPAAVRCIDGEQLFAGAREVQIVHGGALYRLKRTALNKLILTK
jgi:hemin uptake protein HemP